MNLEAKNQLSKKVTYLRENNGLSIEELSNFSKISIDELEAIEGGNTNIDSKILEDLSKIFKVPLSYLTDHKIENSADLNYLTRAMEKLSEDDHDELLLFTDLLEADIEH